MRTASAIGFVAAAALSFCFPDFTVFRFAQMLIWAIALVGLVLLCGVSGQFSFAQAALYGMGGYAAAIAAAQLGGPGYAGLLLAPFIGYAAGYGLGRVASGHSIWTQALVSYALAIAFPQFLRWPPIEYITGGVRGLYLDSPPAPFGLSPDRWVFLLSLGLLAAGLLLADNIIRSRSGRAMTAARDDELAAAAQGISVVHVRSIASGLAGGYLALAGCLASYQYGYVGPATYNFTLSVQMLFGVVIGGMHSLSGALLGAVFLEFFPDLVAPLGKGLSALLYAVLLIGAMVAMPNGIAGAIARLIRSFRWRARASAMAAKGQALSPSAD